MKGGVTTNILQHTVVIASQILPLLKEDEIFRKFKNGEWGLSWQKLMKGQPLHMIRLGHRSDETPHNILVRLRW
jgi:hypothetical protein